MQKLKTVKPGMLAVTMMYLFRYLCEHVKILNINIVNVDQLSDELFYNKGNRFKMSFSKAIITKFNWPCYLIIVN